MEKLGPTSYFPEFVERGEAFETQLLILARDFRTENPDTIEVYVRCDEAIMEMLDQMTATGVEGSLPDFPEDLSEKLDIESVHKWRVHMLCTSPDRVILSKFLEKAEKLAREHGAVEEYLLNNGERIGETVETGEVSEFASYPVYSFYPQSVGQA